VAGLLDVLVLDLFKSVVEPQLFLEGEEVVHQNLELYIKAGISMG
jgi:hypothetical protein